MKKIISFALSVIMLILSVSAFSSAVQPADNIGSAFTVAAAQNTCKVNIYPDTDSLKAKTYYVSKDTDAQIDLPYTKMTKYGKAFAGWSETPGGKIILADISDIRSVIADKDEITLYPVWVTPYLASDEIYPFNNSSYYFDVDKEDDVDAKYFMTDKDHQDFVRNLYKTFNIGPAAVIGSIVFAFYPNWDFKGSCYGMSATTALQHYGLVDMLRYGENAEKLIDLEPTKELISAINYYQYGALVSFFCENIVINGDSVAMKRELKNIVDTVESGKIVLFTYYDKLFLVSSGHSVLLTGAYTDKDGNHVLLIYDNRYPNDYQYNFNSRLVISKDYTSVKFFDRYNEEEPVNAINWLSDFTVFNSININGGGSVASWYKAFFNHISYFFKHLF